MLNAGSDALAAAERATHPPPVPSPTTPDFIALQRAVAGRYAVEREIGRGGMGIVFLAHDVALERAVAIKLLPPAFAAQPVLRERFLREARTAAGLSHPHIVPIHGVEEQGDLVFFVMGYVDGETLARRVQRAGPLPPADVARVMQETAWALSYAHGRGIVHRDIKPDNILLEVGSGRAMVLDFGIARQSSAGALTEMGHVVGTPEYMSPEQAAGEAMDGRSDLYSLGVVGYLALTGKAPFEATSASALLSMHLTQPPAPVASVRPGVPRPLAEAIDRCLRKSPAERFATGEELANALGGVRSGSTEIAPQVRHFMRYAEQYTMMSMVILIIVAEIWLLLRSTKGPAGPVAFGMLFGMSVMVIDLAMRARRVMSQGFSFEDIRAGFELDREARRRELDLSNTLPADARRRRLVIALVATAVGVWVMNVGIWLRTISARGTPQRTLARVIALTGIAVAMVGYFGALFGNTAIERKGAMGYSRLWGGRFGRLFFRLAGWRLTRRDAAVSRSVAEAIEDALRERPRAERKRGAEAVKLARKLEEMEHVLRRREDELDRLLAEAGSASPSTPLPGAAGAFEAHRHLLAEDLRRAREELEGKRAVVSSAIEALRMQVLRMRAGIATVEDVVRDAENAKSAGETSTTPPRPLAATTA